MLDIGLIQIILGILVSIIAIIKFVPWLIEEIKPVKPILSYEVMKAVYMWEPDGDRTSIYISLEILNKGNKKALCKEVKFKGIIPSHHTGHFKYIPLKKFEILHDSLPQSLSIILWSPQYRVTEEKLDVILDFVYLDHTHNETITAYLKKDRDSLMVS